MNDLARRLMDHAEHVMPAQHRTWSQAMRAELDHIADPAAAAAFALDCVKAAYAQRIEDVMTLTRLTRWTLTVLALAWAGFWVMASVLMMAIKSSPNIMPEDLGSDPGTEEALRFIQAYPTWELAVMVASSALTIYGAVELARRRPRALPVLAFAVAALVFLAVFDLRLPEYREATSLFETIASLLIPLLFLAPVWWLCRRAPDLKATA